MSNSAIALAELAAVLVIAYAWRPLASVVRRPRRDAFGRPR